VTCLEADEVAISGQIFNVVFANFRVCEMALRIREALRDLGIDTDLKAEYIQKKARDYRVSGCKMERVLGFKPGVGIQESVKHTIDEFQRGGIKDLDQPNYYNIRWFDYLEKVHTDSIFD